MTVFQQWRQSGYVTGVLLLLCQNCDKSWIMIFYLFTQEYALDSKMDVDCYFDLQSYNEIHFEMLKESEKNMKKVSQRFEVFRNRDRNPSLSSLLKGFSSSI